MSTVPIATQQRIEDLVQRGHDLFCDSNPYIPRNYPDALSLKASIKQKTNYKVHKCSLLESTQNAEMIEKFAATKQLLLTNGAPVANSSGDASATSGSSNSMALVNVDSKKKASGASTSSQAAASSSSVVSASPIPGMSTALAKRMPPKVPTPTWHAPWELSAVVSGHLGWVRSIAFDPSNEWFCTGSADRTIKIWDLAKCCAGAEGGLKLTLTGHISPIRGLAVSNRHPYLFSAGEDKMVKCWDLEYNKVIRHYHGHLSGVYSLALHPTLELLITGGRDSVARVWDIRTKHQIHVLGGHTGAVGSLITKSVDPQVVTASNDSTIKLWDLAAGRAMATLTHHKKSVRAICPSQRDMTFVSASADNIKRWQYRDGKFLSNLSGHNSVINALAMNEDNVLVSGGDNGSLSFWDVETGYCFQSTKTIVQPGSLDAEAGIFAMSFDLSGSRLITCEADKTLKIWKENSEATEESHPVDMKAWSKHCLALKRF